MALILAMLPLCTRTLKADPPLPPLGMRWVLNPAFSDEFNGNALDLTKWYNYHPTWKGRPPGLFMPSQVSVANGYMSIRGEKMAQDTVVYYWDGSSDIFNIKAGAVVSRSEEAFYGYYECRFKANKTTMSTTFWLSSKGGGFPGPEACADKYGQEWDIQECIGREGSFDGSWFGKGMHSNSHIHYYDCQGVKHDYRGTDIRFADEVLASDTFNIYGGWWHDEYSYSSYYNNGEPKYGRFHDHIIDPPFKFPMGVNLVQETYPYPWISLPTDEELADSTMNISYYDWVRAYNLYEADEPVIKVDPFVFNGGFETGSPEGWKGWPSSFDLKVISDPEHVYAGDYAIHMDGTEGPEQLVRLLPQTTYTLSCYGKTVSGSLTLGVKGAVTASTSFSGGEFGLRTLEFTTGTSAGVTIYCYALTEDDEGYADEFMIVESNPGPELLPDSTVMFDEKVFFTDSVLIKTARAYVDFNMAWMSNTLREINLMLFDPDSVLVGEQKYRARGGFGHKIFVLDLDPVPAPADGYILMADIRPVDAAFEDAYMAIARTFNLASPVHVDVKVLDLRDDSPVTGAMVHLGSEEGSADANGQVSFPGQDAGSMTVEAYAEGYEDFGPEVYFADSDTSLILHLTPVSYNASFTLSNSHTGELLDGAMVSTGDQSATADHNGLATLALFEGNYNILASLERYHDRDLNLQLSGDTALKVFMDQALADVKFVVKKDGSTLSGATVSIAGQTETTSTLGMALFRDLETGTDSPYRVEKDSQVLTESSVTFLADTTIRLYLGETSILPDREISKLRVYPIPAKNELWITGHDPGCEYQIMDLHGRHCMSGRIVEDRIELSPLPEGIYLLQAGKHPVLRISIIK